MWSILFIITLTVAIAFIALAAMLQPKDRDLSNPANRRSHASKLPLLRRMTVLGLDPAALADAEPALFRCLKARCRGCESKARCARDLADDLAAYTNGWRAYCPNHAMLNLLGALRGSPLDLFRAAGPSTP
jgi:hypothetical protein